MQETVTRVELEKATETGSLNEKKGAFDKMSKLIETEVFVNLEQADNMIDWEMTKTVVL